MIRKLSLEAITALLVALFVYTAVSKMLDLATFSEQMHNQPLPGWLTESLIWAIPSLELAISGLLIIRPFRLYGLLLAFVLLSMFTVYVGLVYFHSFHRIPCSCGGVFEDMSWGAHLIFNIAFTSITLAGLYLERLKFLEFKRV